MTIGELAEQAGVATSAIRYYEERGLLRADARLSGRRRYEPEALHRLAVILLCREAGFSLDEIGDMLDAPPGRRRRLSDTKLRELDARIATLEAAKRLTAALLECDCPTLEVCELLNAARH